MSTSTNRSTPRFSVVTATRNDLAGLRRTWASLQVQTDPSWEWVVVDGASSDGSVDWLRALDDQRVRWASEPDDGIYDAMNRGIDRARGDLLVFLGAGDRLASAGVLAAVGADQADHGWAWAYGIVRVVDRDGDLLQVASFVPFRRRLLELGYHALCHQACFFSRELVARIGRYDPEYGLHADQHFCLRAAYDSPPRVLGEVVADFEQVGASSTLPADSFVRIARRMRADTGHVVGHNRAVDAAVTAMLGTELRTRVAVGKWARRS